MTSKTYFILLILSLLFMAAGLSIGKVFGTTTLWMCLMAVPTIAVGFTAFMAGHQITFEVTKKLMEEDKE